MSQRMIGLLLDALAETAAMVGVSLFLAAALGIPLGVLLLVSSRGHILERLALNRVVGWVVNATRSTPFIILMVAIIPLTRAIVGTSIGTAAATVPLVIAATPFVARLVEASLREVDGGLIEAAQAMGASPLQIVLKVLIPEALPGIAAALTITTVSLIGYSAMAGAVGGGGLGDLGIRYGYQRFEPEVMAAVVVVLIALVQLVQSAGDRAALVLNKRNLRRTAGKGVPTP
ncbi:MAG TPA: methionine ABC transporter permease [Magnetospirillum sp.]|nr:methionine ABC transporter permease [Magnetospirillum sp.]